MISNRSILTKNNAILFLIAISALLLRLYDLGKESLWVDEIISVTRSQHSLGELMGMPWRPVHEGMLHFWIKLFGSSEFSVRFPSVVFGTVCVFVLYRVGALMFNKRTALLSALLVSLSSFHVYYSQEARDYALFSMLTLFSMYFFLRVIRKQNLALVVGYIISSFLMAWCHPYGPFLILAQNVYVITTWLVPFASVRPNWKHWIILQLVLCLTLLPRLRSLFMAANSLQTNPICLAVPAVSDIICLFRWAYSGGSALLFLLFIALSLLSLKIRLVNADIREIKSRGRLTFRVDTAELSNIYLLSVWLLIPIFVPFVISRISAPIFCSKYTIGASFAFYLLIAHGIDNISGKYVRVAAMGIVVILSLVSTLPMYGRVDKQQWREVSAYVETHAKPGDLVLFNTILCQKSFDYYASSRTDLTKKGFPEVTPSRPPLTKQNIEGRSEVITGHSRIWLILSFSTHGLIVKHLSEFYDIIHEGDYHFIKLYLFERNTNDIEEEK